MGLEPEIARALEVVNYTEWSLFLTVVYYNILLTLSFSVAAIATESLFAHKNKETNCI